QFLSTPAKNVTTNLRLWSSAKRRQSVRNAAAKSWSRNSRSSRFRQRAPARVVLPQLAHAAPAAIREARAHARWEIWISSINAGNSRALPGQPLITIGTALAVPSSLTFITSIDNPAAFGSEPAVLYDRGTHLHGPTPHLRVKTSLQAKVWGIDAKSRPFSQVATIVNISDPEIVLTGLRCTLKPGAVVDVQYDGSVAEFLVVWTGMPGAAALQRVSPGTCMWDPYVARACGVEATG